MLPLSVFQSGLQQQRSYVACALKINNAQITAGTVYNWYFVYLGLILQLKLLFWITICLCAHCGVVVGKRRWIDELKMDLRVDVVSISNYRAHNVLVNHYLSMDMSNNVAAITTCSYKSNSTTGVVQVEANLQEQLCD